MMLNEDENTKQNLDDLWNLGVEVFGNVQSFLSWCETPNDKCQGKQPLELSFEEQIEILKELKNV